MEKWYVDPQHKGIVRFNDDLSTGVLAGTKAQQIVTAVNSHAELLEALKNLVEKCLNTDGYSQKVDELYHAQQVIARATAN